jgi:hypothetical protein
MLAARLIQLIETHAASLTRGALHDIATNPRTPAFELVPRPELEARIFTLYRNLGSWIGDRSDDAVRAEYEEWGGRRFRDGIPLSEIVYAVTITKQHLRRFVRDHGLVEGAPDRVDWGEVLPVHLYGIQELNTMVGEFFDRAIYYLARGYESAAAWERKNVAA